MATELDPRTNFAAIIKMHTEDGHRILSDPGAIRDVLGAALDKTGIEEEIDYTLSVYRTEAETDTVTEHIVYLEQRIRELEARLAALDWTPITAENLPKVGDEIWGEGRAVMQVEDWVQNMLGDDPRVWHQSRFTHRRPITPPAPAKEKANGNG